MITEDYVSFEIAKLLKEKGFPQEYNKYHSMVYNEEDYEDEYEVQRMVLETKLVKAGTLSSYPVGVPDPKCYCCTLQMAMKWLREVQDLIIYVKLVNDGDLCHDAWGFVIYNKFTNEYIKSDKLWFKYEGAAEAAIKYCLENLVK